MSSEIIRVTIREWESATPENQGELLAGKGFGSDETARTLARQLTRSGKLEVTELASGLNFRAKSYVGRIQLGRWQVTIQPKIPTAPLLNLVRYAYDLRHLDLFDQVGFAVAGENFQDLLIHQLVAEADELLARGLHRQYERCRTILAAPRGRLDFAAYVSVAASARAALPCIDHPLTHDTRLNQVLLAGLRFARRLTENASLRREVDRLAKMLEPGLSSRVCDQVVVEKVRRSLDRRTSVYAPALTLISLLLEARGVVATRDVEAAHLAGFLFDMNRFFQALLSRFFREHLEGCTVSEEHQLKGMFRYDPVHNPLRKNAPTPRPDFVVHRPGVPAVVLDAKYRDLWAQSLPREMLYQVALYALAQHGPTQVATILYPTLDGSAKEQAIQFCDPMLGTPQPKQTTLYYREGSSDKVYHVSLEANGSPDHFLVRFAFGRRGSTLQTGTKTPAPVGYDTALKTFNQLIAAKVAKGYTPGQDGTPYQHTGHEGHATGIYPQLLEPLTDTYALGLLLIDPLYCAQEKLDGKRLMLRKQGSVVEGINRKGLIVSVPESSFVVTLVHSTRRSVSLGLYAQSEIVDAGNVTIPSNHDIPKAGSVVEVRYLYAFRQSGAIYQPCYLGERDDIEPAECTTSQLKYRHEPAATLRV